MIIPNRLKNMFQTTNQYGLLSFYQTLHSPTGLWVTVGDCG